MLLITVVVAGEPSDAWDMAADPPWPKRGISTMPAHHLKQLLTEVESMPFDWHELRKNVPDDSTLALHSFLLMRAKASDTRTAGVGAPTGEVRITRLEEDAAATGQAPADEQLEPAGGHSSLAIIYCCMQRAGAQSSIHTALTDCRRSSCHAARGRACPALQHAPSVHSEQGAARAGQDA